MRNLTCALFEHGRITTTVAKAKAVRPFAERLITLAKRGLAIPDPRKALYIRRLVVARLGNKMMMRELFERIAPRFVDRPGGYTRIIKRPEYRLGDAGQTAFLELLQEGETKVKRERAPAPKVTEPAQGETPPGPAEGT
jgi:large subunit ribosomal protein L17